MNSTANNSQHPLLPLLNNTLNTPKTKDKTITTTMKRT